MRLSRFRLRVLRRVAPPWLLAALLAASTGAVVWHITSVAEQRRRAWGEVTEVLVATRAVAAGDTLDAANTTRRTLPRAAVAADTLSSLPAGRAVARQALGVAEPIRAERVSSGLAAPGSVIVAVANSPATPGVRPGDRIDLYGRAATPVATEAVVVAVGTDGMEVAVPAEAVSAVVAALVDGVVTVVVRR